MSEGKKCELCKEQPAAILCSDCYRCYCDECSKFIHEKTNFNDHKVEDIAEGIIVNAMCPSHNDTPLKLFCVNEVKLYCAMCIMKNPHEDHKLVEITEIQEDNEIFSAQKERILFEEFIKRTNDLNKKIGGVIEKIENVIKGVQEEVKKTFDEKIERLKKEEERILNELEDIKIKNVTPLEEHLVSLSKVIEYGNLLMEVGTKIKGNWSRLMELNIVGEMEKQRNELELLCEEEMYDLHVTWDYKEKKLSYVKKLFNGAPIPRNIAFQTALYKEVEITWECDVSKVREEDRDKINYVVEMMKNDIEEWKEVYSGKEMKCTVKDLEMGTEYAVRVRCVVDGSKGKWNEKSIMKIPIFSDCVWEECPNNVDNDMKYSVDANNHRIATMKGDAVEVDGKWVNMCTIIGNAYLPLYKVNSWNIKILKSKYSNVGDIYIGVAPFNINQIDEDNERKCGWYFNCHYSTLCSGPPHNYKDKKYGPRKGIFCDYVHTGDIIGVVMNMLSGELSFVLDGVNLGVAYEGIPLDKPLVPCVILYHKEDSIEFNTPEVKETIVDTSIPVPQNITTKSVTWNSITLTWNIVDRASFYQIELDGRRFRSSTTNTFTKSGLLPESEHHFRVRTVKDNNRVSEWSDIVKGRTLMKSFETSFWKKCPAYVYEKRKYAVDEKNPRIATKIDNANYLDIKWVNQCTIIGSAPLPSNTVTSWNIKILESKYNDGNSIYIGVAPFDINQNEDDNDDKCGWYFNCWNSMLYSGPPHNCRSKEYGPRKKGGNYVHTGDIVGVIMDITKGDLSFVLNSVNLGVAYEGISLDKPLVPCVVLYWKDDSVELVIK